MENLTFIESLSKQGWDIQLNTEDLKRVINERVNNTSEDFKNFITSFDICANKEDNTWFLSYRDYDNKTDSAFPWNEFEEQSLQSAERDSMDAIKKFWESHLPFLMSVKNGYQYVAIGIGEENAGKIYYGREPEYEEAILIAESFSVFSAYYIDALDQKFQSNYYKLIV
ncbi:hypothetical protein [Chitinophaga sp. RAB17]|uniref:hypothetical protein n=1 Tax=Chitinophaga sp. RAB17 TaxID=3233049 RepID=UPI003F8E7301